MSFTIRHLAILAMVFSPAAFSQAGLVGQKSTDGKIRFQGVEEFQIDGSHRVRLLPLTTQRITPDEAKRLPRLELAQAGIIRTDPNNRLVRLDDSGKPTDLILPDDFAPKAAVDASAAQPRLPIQAFQTKKTKVGELIAPELFFVFIPGPDPDRLALAFVNRAPVFRSLDEQLAAMEGLVSSFPDSPVKSEFRDQLRDRLAAGIAAFENRGPYAGLLLTRRFAQLAQRAFPGDPALGELEAAISTRIQTIDAARLNLYSLAASGEWDLLLNAYLPFEPYQWSFADIMELHQTALEESARLHAHRGALLAERQLNADAIRELALAIGRDPENPQTAQLLETTRQAAAQAEAATAKPRTLTAGSPEYLRFNFGLHDAERALQDKDLAKAETALQQAIAENKDAPEVLILQAKLLQARGRDTDALAILDRYDRTVPDQAARDTGKTTRAALLLDLEQKRAAFKQQLAAFQRNGEYSKMRPVTAAALTLDPNDDDFLYYSGAVAAVFREQAAAKERLDRYLVRSDNLRADPQARGRAIRIRALLDAPPRPQLTGTANWFSGRPLADDIYYCPDSGAFQLPIDSIQGNKLKMTFQWDGNRLNSIVSAVEGGAESQGSFFFAYAPSDPQVQVVSTAKFDGPLTLTDLRVTHDAANPPHLVDGHGRPRILLQDSPQFNPAVLTVLEGPLATTVAGNPFFNPFIWDGLHYFSLTYGPQGRIATAREWNADNLLRFTWSGNRLTEIRAFHKDSISPYYQRTIGYSGTMLTGETYSAGSRGGQIKYLYSGKALQQVKVEDGGVHDGKTWTVRIR